MQRTISKSALLFTSVSAILGSGWLFAAYYTSILSGPSALIAWLLGGTAMIIVAFVFAEISSMIPVMGSSTRIPQFTHGTLVSFAFSWLIWLSYASLVPAEVQAIIQYLNFYFPSLVYSGGALTSHGYMLATGLMLSISAINIFSLRWLIRCNNVFTLLKIIIPTVISLIILFYFFSPHQVLHPGGTAFMPYGFHGILAAITSGGIVFAFNGFKQACEMAGEAKNPNCTVPFAIIGSIALCLGIYLLLQLAFLSSLNPQNLIHGFAHIQLGNSESPFAAIIHQDHMPHLLSIIYIGAIVGPLAAALMYASSAGRSLYGKSKNGYLPSFFQKLSAQGNPLYAIIANFFIGMCLFAPLPGWNNMIAFLTSLMGITYAIAPICLLSLRQQVPNQRRPFKLPYPKIWATASFYICTLLIYWSGWNIVSKLGIAMLAGACVLLVYRFSSKRGRALDLNWKASIWMWPYFVGISLISFLGNFGHGLGVIPFGWDFAVIALFSIAITYLAVKFKLPAEVTQKYIQEIKLEREEQATTPTKKQPKPKLATSTS